MAQAAPTKKHASLHPKAAKARPKRVARGQNIATFPADAADSPAARYAAMSSTEALAELDKRRIAYAKVDEARGVLTPVRLTAPLHGVTWRTEVSAKERPTTPWEVFDASLVLALDDFGSILEEHGIDDVIIFSAWRPPAKSWPVGKLGIRHPGAMAVDVRRLHKREADVWLDVEGDFHGAIGATTCGENATAPTEDSDAAKELRAIACTAGDKRFFQSILTPNYNAPHRNHFHMEVRRDVPWFLMKLERFVGVDRLRRKAP